MGGSCCTTKDERDCDSHMRKIILSFKFNTKSYLEMYKEIRMKAVNDFIKVKEFYELCENMDLLSPEQDIKKIQEGIFKSYFQVTKAKKINIYELLLILLPLLNNTDNKNKALKEITSRLTYKKEKTKKEVIMFYYSFATIFITKAVAYTISKDVHLKRTYENILFEYKVKLSTVYSEAIIKKEVDELFGFEKNIDDSKESEDKVDPSTAISIIEEVPEEDDFFGDNNSSEKSDSQLDKELLESIKFKDEKANNNTLNKNLTCVKFDLESKSNQSSGDIVLYTPLKSKSEKQIPSKTLMNNTKEEQMKASKFSTQVLNKQKDKEKYESSQIKKKTKSITESIIFDKAMTDIFEIRSYFESKSTYNLMHTKNSI